MKIKDIQAIEILDSRGKPTVRAFVKLIDDSVHIASVPSGASTGTHEAVELRDGNQERHHGMGVLDAVNNVNETIKNALKDKSVKDPEKLDKEMIDLDGTENKSKLGANAILAVSQALIRAAAYTEKIPVWKFINQFYFRSKTAQFPRVMVNIVNGGKHANWNFDIQEFMVIPVSNIPSESVRVAAEIFHQLGKLLKKQKYATLVGDEGGYSPALGSNEDVFDNIVQAAMSLGYKNEEDFQFGIDAAASEFYKNGEYVMQKTGQVLSGEKLIEYYNKLMKTYKVFSLEDPFAEDDWYNFKAFSEGAFNKYQVVGDDLFVTNTKRIQRGIDNQAANAVLIKLNQIGSVKETIEAIKLTKSVGWKVCISHRSGETEDPFIADLAYGSSADFIKTGSMSRSDRLAKYNRLLEIENKL